MLTQAITGAQAWTAATIDDSTHWYYHLPDACLAAFEQMPHDQRPLTEIVLTESLRAECVDALQPVRSALETGRGFAIIQSPALAAKDATLLYWIVGQGLGRPFAQNVQGTMLYDVRDTGQSVAQGARFSVTNYESSFHTDNSFGSEVLDYVGLLCLAPAKTGGRSQTVSGIAVHNEMLREHPAELATLYQPFHVDRRGGVREGETPTILAPVFASGEPSPVRGRLSDAALTGPLRGSARQDLLVRYLRYWIEAGHEKIGVPLTAPQKSALDALDETLNRPDLRVEFDLKSGDMYFINNRWILHNRTAFEDHAEPERRRHLVRLWLRV